MLRWLFLTICFCIFHSYDRIFLFHKAPMIEYAEVRNLKKDKRKAIRTPLELYMEKNKGDYP